MNVPRLPLLDAYLIIKLFLGIQSLNKVLDHVVYFFHWNFWLDFVGILGFWIYELVRQNADDNFDMSSLVCKLKAIWKEIHHYLEVSPLVSKDHLNQW